MRIVVYGFDGITMFHLAAPLLVFGEVGRLGLADGWDPTVWSSDGHGFRTVEGLRVEDVSGPEVVRDADLVVLPSWPMDLRPAGTDFIARLRETHQRGGRLAGLCLGAFPLVDAGLVDDRAVVTHWSMVDHLKARRPGTAVTPAALYLDHGDLLTSAGTASAIDACLHIVRRELGTAAAATVARHLVVAPHRDGDQAQYISRPVTEPGGVGDLGSTLDWALSQLGERLSVDVLASHAGMSRRNFTRRFQEATGATPARWILARRLDEARRLLETTDWAMTRIASECGFASAVTFRQNFVSAYATTPTSYRQRFTATTTDAT